MACAVILGAARSQMYLVQLSRVSNVNSMKHGQIMDLTHKAYFGGFETDTTSFDEEASNAPESYQSGKGGVNSHDFSKDELMTFESDLHFMTVY